jgi:uncharacterized hydrophobic protein (TIGR00341 family)
MIRSLAGKRMKKLEVTVTKEQSEKIEEVLRGLGLLFASSSIKLEGKECIEYSALVPDQFLDKAMGEIQQKMDLRVKENTMSVYNVEAQVSTYVDRLREKANKETSAPNPFERLVEATERYRKLDGNILTMALFATLIAIAGLFLDNAVIVIGAMLLSPLLGPINAFAVNATLGRIRNLLNIQLSILALLFSVILLSTVITLITSQFMDLTMTSQILLRGNTSLTDVGIGLVLGFAGGLALVTAIPEILVGVGVASALLPPAAVAGIGLALVNTNLFLGALTLTIIYLVGLQLGCTVMLRVKGVQPRKFYEKAEARKHLAYFILTFSLLLALLIWLVAIGFK